MSAPREWRIVERFGRFYVECQYGGFAGWHNDRESAIQQGRQYVEDNPGDTFPEGVSNTPGKRRAPIHGPGTYDGAVMGTPHRLSRETDPDCGITIHEHGVAGAVIKTHRTYRVSPVGWVYRVTRGEWSDWGYTRTQREALEVAVGRLCRAVDAGEVGER